MIVGLIVLGVVFATIQVAILPYQWVFAYIISIFMYFSFNYVVWVAVIAGLSYSVLRVSILGGSSVLLLGLIGIMQFVMASRSQQASRSLLRDGLFFLPVALIDGVVKVSAAQFAGDIAVFVFVYWIVSYISRRRALFVVRKSL